MKDIPIKSLEIFDLPIEDIGAESAKLLSPGERYRYKLHGCYNLSDGRQIKANIQAMTKPKLQERLKSIQESIAAGRMKACFDDNGRFWGTSTSYSI